MATNTPFGEKCEILHDFYMAFLSKDDWQDFIQTNDLGLPAAYLSVMGCVEITPAGVIAVNQTWDNLCEMLEVDPNENYATLGELMGEWATTV